MPRAGLAPATATARGDLNARDGREGREQDESPAIPAAGVLSGSPPLGRPLRATPKATPKLPLYPQRALLGARRGASRASPQGSADGVLQSASPRPRHPWTAASPGLSMGPRAGLGDRSKHRSWPPRPPRQQPDQLLTATTGCRRTRPCPAWCPPPPPHPGLRAASLLSTVSLSLSCPPPPLPSQRRRYARYGCRRPSPRRQGV